jgi:uncharacterized protein YndB with AHSA1/START domain
MSDPPDDVGYPRAMAAATRAITIERSAADVFDVLAHVELASRWSQAISEELITPGPLRVGSRRRAVVRTFGGLTSENVMELTELEPGRRLAMRSVSGLPFPIRISIDLEPRGDATRMTWVAKLEPTGALRLTAPFLATVYGRVLAKDLRTLKTMMEAGDL